MMADNFDAAARKINAMARLVGDGLKAEGLRVIGESIMTDVKASREGHGVPVDQGTLRGSGRVEGPAGGVVTLSFGGSAAPYALRQHEELSYRHTVGEARYLVRGLERFKAGGFAGVELALRENAEEGVRKASRS
jgi:hypothetical protein